MKYTVVIPTIGRSFEVAQLLGSIVSLNRSDLEIIIVDQNQDDRLQPVVAAIRIGVPIQHLRVNFKGAARARNYGLQYARGEIINFADDDATFRPGAFDAISDAFSQHPDADMVSLRVVDPETQSDCMLRFPEQSCVINERNCFHVTVECVQFWRRKTLQGLGGYDPRLGVGTYFGAEEGADLVVRSLTAECTLRYIPFVGFEHPAKVQSAAERFYKYARGTGFFFRKHFEKPHVRQFISVWFVKGVVGSLVFLLFKPRKAFCYSARIAGFLVGFWRSKRDLGSRAVKEAFYRG